MNERAEIKIYRSHHGDVVVGEKGFSVYKAVFELVNFNPGVYKGREKALRHYIYYLLVRNVGDDYPHVYPTLCRTL